MIVQHLAAHQSVEDFVDHLLSRVEFGDVVPDVLKEVGEMLLALAQCGLGAPALRDVSCREPAPSDRFAPPDGAKAGRRARSGGSAEGRTPLFDYASNSATTRVVCPSVSVSSVALRL